MSEAGMTLSAIQPLVSHQRATGRHLIVTFRCPVSGKQENTKWTAPQSSGLMSSVGSQVKRSAWYEVRRQANMLVRSVLGHGVAGRIATQTLNTAIAAAPMGTSSAPKLSASQTQEGLVEAFRTVSSRFVWTQRGWVHASAAGTALPPMAAQLHEAPLGGRYDQLLVARMLVELAGSDGSIGDDEMAYLQDTIDPDLGSVEGLRQRPPLTHAELGEATAGPARISMMTVVWIMALVDERLAPPEAAALHRFAQGLELKEMEATRARHLARMFVIEQALDKMVTWGGHDQHAREELVKLGERIGMSREQVELAEAKMMKRRLA